MIAFNPDKLLKVDCVACTDVYRVFNGVTFAEVMFGGNTTTLTADAVLLRP